MTHRHLFLTTVALAAFAAAGCEKKAEEARPASRAPETASVPVAPPAKEPAPVAKEPAPVAKEPAPAAKDPAPAVEKKTPPVVAEQGSDVGMRIPAYKNTVKRADGSSAELDTHAAGKPRLYIVNSTACSYCTAYVDRMKTIETTYLPKGVDVVHVYPVPEQTAEAKNDYHAKKGFQGGLVVDQDGLFGRELGITKTPTAILTDASGTIVYRGRIDDNAKADKVKSHELANAIDEHLAGAPVTVTTTEPFG